MDTVKSLTEALLGAFEAQTFLRKLAMSGADAAALVIPQEWEGPLNVLLPFEQRLTCDQVLEMALPLLNRLTPPPKEGWMVYAYHVAVSLLYDEADVEHTAKQRDAALCYLNILQVLFDAEREVLPFDPQFDFAFCTEEELAHSSTAEEYRQFLVRFRGEYVYEAMRLGREVTPFRTLEHIAGVHHVAMSVMRPYYAAGGCVDLPLLSGAAAGHDIGKFGCKPGERVPYLHYHYTDQWFTQRGLETIGHIAANHSVWDLELENLSSESLALVYADFRVKQSRDESGQEIARIYSLQEAFDVILSKLDNVNYVKELRYRHVYAKLVDFEDYICSFGADATLSGANTPPPPKTDPALMRPQQVVTALRLTAVDHNLRLMHRLGHEQLFANILESARSEQNAARLGAYLGIFEEYFTYWSASQKEQTLEFLYDLLLIPDGGVRRQAAALMGRVLAGFNSGYKKELPSGAEPDPADRRPFALWKEYLARLIYPDRRLTPVQVSRIRYAAKLAVDSLLSHASRADGGIFAAELFRHYADPRAVEDGAAFALLDTVVNFPLSQCSEENLKTFADFAIYWLANGGEAQKAAAMRLLRHLLEALPEDAPERESIYTAAAEAECGISIPLLFLQTQLCRRFGLDMAEQEAFLRRQSAISNVFLDNLKTATPWLLKAVGVEYLLEQVEQGGHQNVLHIATHFSNLMKVSENVVVRQVAGASLLSLASLLTPDRRNEIAVELSKSLETGDVDSSKYIPEYLGRFSLWLHPRELDEVIGQMEFLLASPNAGVVSAALRTIGSMLEYYAVYAARFQEDDYAVVQRRTRLAGLLLRGLASCRESVRQTTLHILGDGLFASGALEFEDKDALFVLMAKKILFLMNESDERELTFFYTAATLSHIYRFILSHLLDDGPFHFPQPPAAAFFPGTFDPFSLSHKGIVQAIRDRGFEVYLAIDEFSWSKKAQPSLVRRQIVSMSVADQFGVYLFPHDIPVNLADSRSLNRLREVFAGRELYLAVGSDVVANASSYRAAPTEGSVQFLNHIVFRRSSDAEGHEIDPDLRCIKGKVLQLELPTHLEDISSTRIRENIDLGRDISNLVDPTVQDYIYRNSLYLREPQYKQLLRASDLDFSFVERPDRALMEDLSAAVSEGRSLPPRLEPGDSFMVLRAQGPRPRILGFLTLRTVNTATLYDALGDANLANYVRERTAGRIALLTGLYTAKGSGGTYDVGQLLLTEALSRSMASDCGYAVWYPTADQSDPETLDLLQRQGFRPGPPSGTSPLLLVDMRSPSVLIQNIPTTLKEPFASNPAVLAAVRKGHENFQRAICDLYPGVLVLSLNAEVIYHRLVGRIVELNNVPSEPTHPRVLGEKMCVPFGKILRGNAIPNTVTKTIHTDKVFAPDLNSFTIEAFPRYAPLPSQIRTLKSFHRPVILVDDLLHSGNRISALDPLFRAEDVEIDRVLVGLLSGRGRDLIVSKGRNVDCVYFVPNMRAWFVESTMYPFIGGDTVARSSGDQPQLTPSVNMILPYVYPRFYRSCTQKAVFNFSRVCIENARDILLTLETEYRRTFARNLTLSRLSEAVILPLAPDKGVCLGYDMNLSASQCLENDLKMLLRMRELERA